MKLRLRHQPVTGKSVVKRIIRGVSALCFILANSVPVLAQQIEAQQRPENEVRARPYLVKEKVDFHTLLAPPPTRGSLADNEDVEIVAKLQDVNAARRAVAEVDARFVYPRFSEAFGRPVERSTSLAMIRLLNRTLRDVAVTTFEAKSHFSRPRPYQRNQLKHVCGEETAPTPEAIPQTGSSYPSGHTSYGWATAMVLARLDPSRSEALLVRAAEYSESRLICGVHFPSDTTAGKMVAAAVVARLDANPKFQADLKAARKELQAKAVQPR